MNYVPNPTIRIKKQYVIRVIGRTALALECNGKWKQTGHRKSTKKRLKNSRTTICTHKKYEISYNTKFKLYTIVHNLKNIQRNTNKKTRKNINQKKAKISYNFCAPNHYLKKKNVNKEVTPYF